MGLYRSRSFDEIVDAGEDVGDLLDFRAVGHLVPDDPTNRPDSAGAGVVSQRLQHLEVGLREVLVEGEHQSWGLRLV